MGQPTFSEQYNEYLDKLQNETEFGQAVPYAQGGEPREVRGFWKEAQEKIAAGGRLVFPERPKSLKKESPSWMKVRLPTNEDYWKEGRAGAFLPGATGTYKEMQSDLKLAQYPGAVEILPSGVPWYGGKTDVAERHLRAEAALEYGERYIDDITFDADTMLEMENSANLAQRMGIAIKAYESKAQGVAEERDTQASTNTYKWIYNNLGKYYHTTYQKAADLMEAGLANGYLLFSGDEEYEKAWAEADAEMAQTWVTGLEAWTGKPGDTALTRAVYNPVTALQGANMFADLAENIFYQWLPWNWGKPDSVHSLDVQSTLTFLKEHPGMSESVARQSYVDDYWWTMADDWLNPMNWAIDRTFDIIFPPLMARTAIRATAKFLPRVARKGMKVTPELAKVLGKLDETARLGGIGDEAFEAIRAEGMVSAFIKDMDGTTANIAKWADEFGVFTHTQETKSALTKEEVQHGIRWIQDSLGHDGNPERFIHRLETVSKLASKDPLEVDMALRELSKIPNFDFWFSQTGQTAAYVMNKGLDIPTSEIDELYKVITKTERTSKKVATLMAWSDEKAMKVTDELFPTLTEMIKKGKKLPEGKGYLRAASKFHDQAQKIYGPVTRLFSNWYLGRTPGYAVRNLTQNYAQTIYDLGLGSIDGWRHIDDAFDWALADEIIEAGGAFAKDLDELFVGMNRDLAGIAGAVGQKLDGKGVWNKQLDARWWASEFEKLGGVTIFGHEYPKEMKKMLTGNLSKQFRMMGLDKRNAQLFEDAIIQGNGSFKKARAFIEKKASDGFWRDAKLRNMAPDIQKKAVQFRYDRKIYEWLEESDNFDDMARNIDNYTQELLDSAEQMVRKEGPAGAVSGVGKNMGVSANAVMDGAAPQAVHDAYNSTRAANKYANRQVGNAIDTMRREVKAGLVSLGYTDDDAAILFQKLTSEVDLVVEGDKAAAVGKINGFDFIEGQKFSPEEIWNKNLYRQQDEIGNRYAGLRDEIYRFNDEPENMAENLKKFWDKNLVEDYGEYAGQDWWEVKRANYRKFILEDRAFWNDWTLQNYNMARRVADSIGPKVADLGIQMAPVEHIFSKAHKSVLDAVEYQKWVPQELIDHALDVARRNPIESRRLWTFATEYAKMYGLDTFFVKEGREFLNHEMLVKTINKQLGTDFPHLNAMTGIKESQIKDAFKAHSLNLYMRIVDDPDRAMALILKAVDPGDYGNTRVLERLSRNELAELKRFKALLQTEDPRLIKEFNQAVQARNTIKNPASAANADEYNKIVETAKKADDILKKAGDNLLELLGSKKVTGQARKFETTGEMFQRMTPDEIVTRLDDIKGPELDALEDWLSEEAPDLHKSLVQAYNAPRGRILDIVEFPAELVPSKVTIKLPEGDVEILQRATKTLSPEQIKAIDQPIAEALVAAQKNLDKYNAAVAKEAKKVGNLIEDDMAKNTEWITQAFDQQTTNAEDFIHVWGGEDAPTGARTIHESKTEILKFAEDLKNGFRSQWDNVVRMDSKTAQKMLDDLESVSDVSEGMLREARLGAMKSVKETRDFILHNYGDRRNIDTMLAYIYPYHFWHTRNAVKWTKRLAERPGMMRYYAKYKERLERINADQPEWFRHNARITGFLGFDNDNPLMVNLEALISPMYQIIKEPFFDPDKRDTAFARILDDSSRVMSVHTMYPLIYGAMRYVQGDKDPAAKWMSRLIPQTKVTTAVSSLAAKKFGLDHWERGVELDPVLGIMGAIEAGDPAAYFSAFDPYEQKRVAMGYQALVTEGTFTEEEIVDAIMSEDPDHPITVAAHGIAQSKKNIGDLFSFVGGPGFQIRNQDERNIMAMDAEFRNLFEASDYMDKDETAQLWQVMRSKYPQYFNTVMLTRKDRDVREKSFVYNVMGRIPPGQTGQIYEAIGMNYEDVQEFYDSKGESLNTMPDADRMKFMAGIYELSTVAAFPDQGTSAEWKEVKTRYGKMRTELEERYGEQTFAARDRYFELLREDPESAYAYLDANPDVGLLMSDETQWKYSDPLMTKYYASYDNARAMLNAEMFDRLQAQFPNGRKMSDEYFAARTAGQRIKASEELKAYWTEKKAIEEIYGAMLVSYGRHFPETGKGLSMPKRFDPNEVPEGLSRGAQELAQTQLDKPGKPVQYDWTWEQWERVMDPTTARLVQDWAFRGAELGEDVESNLEYVLQGMNIDKDEALYLIQQAAQRGGAQFYGPENPPWWQGQ